MNHFEKKCFATVASAHGLMLLILLIGPGFFMAPEKPAASQPITAYDPATISKLLSTGGTPQPVQAVPLPPPAAPVVQPAPPEPTPPPKPPDIPKQVKPEPKDMHTPEPEIKVKPVTKGDEPVIKSKKARTVQINPDEMTPSKNNVDKLKAERQAEADRRARAKAAAEARQREVELKELGSAVKSLQKNMSGKTQIDFNPGVGGGGAATVNYFQLIQSILDNAWNPSRTLTEDTQPTTISVTILRDGTLRGRIIKHSSNASMDRSVQNVLDTVTSVEPFPASFKEQQVTATFTFDVKAKR